MKQHEEKEMAYRETKALLKAIEIIIELCETKEQIKKNVKRIAKELGKEPTDTDQGNR